MPRQSAGILLYRDRDGRLEVLLVHPGGPFWTGKDLGAWSLPKGEHGPDDDPLACALREFEEETGHEPPREGLLALGAVKQRGGKVVTAWAVAGDLDPDTIVSNSFRVQWPPGSGNWKSFPEVDRAGWFDLDSARQKLVSAQAEFVDRLVAALAAR